METFIHTPEGKLESSNPLRPTVKVIKTSTGSYVPVGVIGMILARMELGSSYYRIDWGGYGVYSNDTNHFKIYEGDKKIGEREVLTDTV